MKTYLFVFALAGLVASTAFAAASGIQTQRCPTSFTAKISNVTAFKTSIYSTVEGWESGRDTLARATADLDFIFVIDKRGSKVCTYRDGSGATAKLTTIALQDPEEYEPIYADRLAIDFELDGAPFGVFVAVEEYSARGLSLFDPSAGRKTKIRTRLEVQGHRYPVRFDVGLGQVSTN